MRSCPYPATTRPGELRRAVDHAEMPVPTETPDRYFEKLARMGGIVEEFIEADEKISPSAQFRTSPIGRGAGDLDARSDPRRRVGPDLPGLQLSRARASTATQIRAAGRRVGEVLARHGVVSRYGVDFLAWRNARQEDWHVTALEINLRVVGTTHPFLALRFLTGGELDAATGAVPVAERARRSTTAPPTTCARRATGASCPKTCSTSSR